MFFIQDEDDERILTLLVEERQLLEEQLIHLEMRRKQLFDDSSRIQKSFGHYLILSRAITRVQGQLDWILEMIEER